MKATKHILKLAESMAKETIKSSDYWTQKDLTHLKKWNSEELSRIKNALLNGRFYASVESVSNSGMSRVIKIGYIYQNKQHIIRDEKILKLAGISKNGRISGGGMDMLFHAQYNLFMSLHRSYKEAHYQKRMSTYNQF